MKKRRSISALDGHKLCAVTNGFVLLNWKYIGCFLMGDQAKKRCDPNPFTLQQHMGLILKPVFQGRY